MKKLLVFLFIAASLFSNAQTYNTVLGNGNTSTLFPNHTSYSASAIGARYGAGFQIQPVALNWTMIMDNSYWDGTKYRPINTGKGSGVLLYSGDVWIKTFPSLTAGDNSGINMTPAYFGGSGTAAIGGSILNNAPTGATLIAWGNGKVAIHSPGAGTTAMPVLVWDATDSLMKQVPFPSGGSGGTPGGPVNSIQYNKASTFAGNGDMTYDTSSHEALFFHYVGNSGVPTVMGGTVDPRITSITLSGTDSKIKVVVVTNAAMNSNSACTIIYNWSYKSGQEPLVTVDPYDLTTANVCSKLWANGNSVAFAWGFTVPTAGTWTFILTPGR